MVVHHSLSPFFEWEYESMKTCLVGICSLLFLTACGGNDVLDRTELHGYKDGELRMKYVSELSKTTLENGEDGILLKTEIRFSEGSKKRFTSTSQMWMKPDFSMVRKEVEKTDNNDKKSSAYFQLVGDKVETPEVIGGVERINEYPMEFIQTEKLIGELHPHLYANELTKPGDNKLYYIFFEPVRSMASLRVRCEAEVTLTIDGVEVPCLRYGLQNIGVAGSYNKYFVTVADKRLVRIENQDLIFVLPGEKP